MICFRLKTGESLHSYCVKNKLAYAPIYRKIDEKGMSVEEALSEYLTNKGRKDFNCKYFYKGKKLTEIFGCDTTQYNTCLYYIKIKGLSIEEAVEKCLHQPTRVNGYKHWYKGVPLIKYCKKHNINYHCVMSSMKLRKKTLEEIMRRYKR